MALKARYFPAQDRMRLVHEPAEGECAEFWVTRRLWLALLKRLRAAGGQLGIEPKLPPKAGPARQAALPAVGSSGPVLLDRVRLRIEGKGASLILLVGDRAHVVQLGVAGLAQLQEMVALQAERAGWDPEAAMQRLDADDLARAAVAQAGET
jgi:hypothetical protein